MHRERERFSDDRPRGGTAGRDTLRVALFAGMAEAAGVRVAEIDWSGGSVAHLRADLEAANPAIGPLLARSAVAIGNRYATDDTDVPVAADVAISPPVSGG